ncbi:Protein fantom [Merluccius polli]|uniref:Protein fantom n=1 Tax=Merluccius polli TaxID=89951 RepID=A0AA47P779_MERPO|nr:Protein fantom [Merluccius polli]
MSTFADETAADMPVKDITLTLSHFATGPQQDTSVGQYGRAPQDLARVSREELEDRYLRLHEENLLLKQNNNNHEDKIKRLATKLVKLVKDRRRLEQLATGGAGGDGARAAGRVRDMEMEEMMEELHEKVRGLQGENERLKQRLLVAKQQAQVQSRRPSPYGRVQSRIDTGRRRAREDSPSPSRLQQRGTRSVEESGRPPTGMLPRYGHSLLEDARSEIRNLENVLESQRGELEELERGSHLLRDQLRRKDMEHQEVLLQLQQHHADGQRSTVSSNVAMIRLQKQLAERASALTVLEGRFLQLQESQKAMKAGQQALMDKVEEVTGQLKEERLKSLGLGNQLHNMNFSQIRTEEVRINDLEKERDLLKENCDKLVNSAFDVSQEQKWRLQEQQLRVQIGQLETALKADLTDKNQILDKIKDERDTNDKLTEENKRLQIQFLEQKQQLEELNGRLKFYTKESELGAAELTEALMLIRARKARQSGELSFLEEVEDERRGDSDTQRSVWEIRAAHAETIQELEKTRGLLLIQNKINKDYQGELDTLTRKMESDKMEYEVKLEHLAKLLDSRAAKIKKLEVQLKDIAYGTKPYVFKPDTAGAVEDASDPLGEEMEVRLENGQNVLEFHVGRATLSSSALESLGDRRQPSTFFCTYGFYDSELHATPVVGGGAAGPDFNFTSRYVVRMDDLFMEYLHACSLAVELHQAEGLTFRMLAVGQLRLQQLLEQDGKVSGTLQLVGVSGEVQCFGSLEFWMKLRVPMQQTLRLYRERLSALGYIHTTLREERHADPQSGSVNVLGITVQRCGDLPIRGAREPSPYVFYKFYDFPYRDTPVAHDRRHPTFGHHTPYSVAMDADLDRYLRAEELQLYVLDFKEEEADDAYLGKARVPLLTLAQNKAISGVFELSSPSGSPAGHIEVALSWKFPYRFPPGSAMTVEQAATVPQETPARPTPELPEEEEEDLPLAKERKHDGELLNGKEIKEKDAERLPDRLASDDSSKAPLPKPRQKTWIKEKLVAKKVSFLDTDDLNQQVRYLCRCVCATCSMQQNKIFACEKRESSKLPPIKKGVSEVTLVPPSTTDDEEEVSQFSEGQLIPVSSQSYSDGSEMSEESIEEDIEGASSVVGGGQGDLSDSDDCIVPGQSSVGKKTSERLRVEIVAVNLKPESRAAHDPSVVRLFVEYSLLDLPSEETPLSLPKPGPGQSVHYNYSNVIHVDQENNRPRRELLRAVLEGRNPQMESIRFTLVSEPPEEEEQERECEDVGVAYLRIPDILEKQQDLMESRLNVVEVDDSSVVLGTLTVSVEALDALRSIMDDPEHDYTPVSHLQAAT